MLFPFSLPHFLWSYRSWTPTGDLAQQPPLCGSSSCQTVPSLPPQSLQPQGWRQPPGVSDLWVTSLLPAWLSSFPIPFCTKSHLLARGRGLCSWLYLLEQTWHVGRKGICHKRYWRDQRISERTKGGEVWEYKGKSSAQKRPRGTAQWSHALCMVGAGGWVGQGPWRGGRHHVCHRCWMLKTPTHSVVSTTVCPQNPVWAFLPSWNGLPI